MTQKPDGLEAKIEAMWVLLQEIQEENKADHAEIKESFYALNGRVRQTEVELARVRERQNIMTALASGIGLAASAIAAWLGGSAR